MIEDSANEFYAIEFSERHSPERVLCFPRNFTREQRAELTRVPIYGWAIFEVKYGIKTPTGLVAKTEQEAKDAVQNWLRIAYEKAAVAARRAVHKANRLAELTGNKQVESTSPKTQEVAPYVWEVNDIDRIFAHGLGIQL